jgi:hypothetical protein
MIGLAGPDCGHRGRGRAPTGYAACVAVSVPDPDDGQVTVFTGFSGQRGHLDCTILVQLSFVLHHDSAIWSLLHRLEAQGTKTGAGFSPKRRAGSE